MKAKRVIFVFLLVLLGTVGVWSQDANRGFHDDIDRNADDFVTVSLLVAEPSEVLYSGFGHCALRMQCPTYNMDYIYSYEGENASDKFVRFFLGQLKMGMMRFPTDVFLDDYREIKRGVRAYVINLSPVAKQNLWRILDQKVAEGMDLPYDYIVRGCGISTSRFIREAIFPTCIEYGDWADSNYRTIREAGSDNLKNMPWSCWILNTIIGSGVDDREANPEDLTVFPEDLLNVWLKAKVDGHPLLNSHYEWLVPQSQTLSSETVITPQMVAIFILLLAIISFWLSSPYIDWLVLAIQTLLGLAITYLLLSDVPNNDWNWLIVPFNPLPAFLWHWRRKAFPVLATINIIWLLGMLLYPAMLVNSANLILAVAVTIILLKYTNINKHNIIKV